ncbi:hypothetical protein VaNZ11_009945 [Volvox africanus]|uniref:RING-type domain-containing protein n=1 Tax=Volvox africanus TaxID=51714 RepID=A0ABQ5S8E5_9CHLO|nr:hypothetical protein VaNZ11_009945 [Volvox africanus]
MDDTNFNPPPELAALAEELACPICKQLFDGPVSLDCGHVFCSGCIRPSFGYAHSKNQKQICPTCRDPSSTAALRPVAAMRKAVLVFPAAAAAVDALRLKAQAAEVRAAVAEQEVLALRAQLVNHSALHTATIAATSATAAAANASQHAGDGIADDSPKTSAQAPSRSLQRCGMGLQHSDLLDEGPSPPLPSLAVGGPESGPLKDDSDHLAGVANAVDVPSPNSGNSGLGTRHRAKRMRCDPGSVTNDCVSTRTRGGAYEYRSSGGGGGSASLHGNDMMKNDALSSSSHSDDGGDADYTCTDDADDNDDDYDYSLGSGRSSRQRGAAVRVSGNQLFNGASQGRKRGRDPGRPAKTGPASVAGCNDTGPPSGLPVASEADGPSVAPVVAVPVAAAAAAEGMQDCPMCGSRYPIGQLQAHVEICLLRKGLGGAGHGSSAGANVISGITTGARGQSARGVASTGRPETGANRALESVRAPAAALATAAATPAATSGPAAPAASSAMLQGRGPANAAPKVDIQVPPARNFHAMSLKDAKKIVKDCGLMVGGDKQEMADMYNKYRSFLQTERDRCSTKSTKQLLPIFLRQEQQAERARRLPPEAPGWMQTLIAQQTAKINAEMAARKKQAATRAVAATAQPGLGCEELGQGPSVQISAGEAGQAVHAPPQFQAQGTSPGGMLQHIGQHEGAASREILDVGTRGPVPVTVPHTGPAGAGAFPGEREESVAGIEASVAALRTGPTIPGPGPPTSSPVATRLDPQPVQSVGVHGLLTEVITIDDSEEEGREELEAAPQGRPQQHTVGWQGGEHVELGAAGFRHGHGAGNAVGANAGTVGCRVPSWTGAGEAHQLPGGGCSDLGGGLCGGEHGAQMQGELLRSDSDGNSSSDEMVDCRRRDGGGTMQALAAYLATQQAVSGYGPGGGTSHGIAPAAAWTMAGPALGGIGPAPHPGEMWQQGSHEPGGSSGGNRWRGLLLPVQPYRPAGTVENLTDISKT